MENLKKSSELTIDLLVQGKKSEIIQQSLDLLVQGAKPEKIVTCWTEKLSDNNYEMDLLYPEQSYIDKIEELDVKSLQEIALDKVFYVKGEQRDSFSSPANYVFCS